MAALFPPGRFDQHGGSSALGLHLGLTFLVVGGSSGSVGAGSHFAKVLNHGNGGVVGFHVVSGRLGAMACWRRCAPVLHPARCLQVSPPYLLRGVVAVLLYDPRLGRAQRAPCAA